MTEVISDKPAANQKPKRPLILTIVTLLLFVRVIIVATFAVLGAVGAIITEETGILLNVEQWLLIVFLFVATLVLLIAAIGLWLLRPWAWQVNMIILGFYLIIGIWDLGSDRRILGNDLTMLLNILSVFYLVQKDVRMLFVSRPPEDI